MAEEFDNTHTHTQKFFAFILCIDIFDDSEKSKKSDVKILNNVLKLTIIDGRNYTDIKLQKDKIAWKKNSNILTRYGCLQLCSNNNGKADSK